MVKGQQALMNLTATITLAKVIAEQTDDEPTKPFFVLYIYFESATTVLVVFVAQF